jgi:hypothetical protein
MGNKGLNSTSPLKNMWNNNLVQFARVIEEAMAAGAFTLEVIEDMAKSMDLNQSDIEELFERAHKVWQIHTGRCS